MPLSPSLYVQKSWPCVNMSLISPSLFVHESWCCVNMFLSPSLFVHESWCCLNVSLSYLLPLSLPGCVHPLLNVALFMILPCLSVLSQSCPRRAHICGQVITPPTFLTSSSSFAISRLPFCYPSCPPIVISAHQMACPSPFSFFDLYHDFCVSDFVSCCDVKG